ncbi:hypothetical protein [Halobaculum gomorrense]|uniref:Uncharacterized protein n=1 Tax=Halobaculum gomorrense TaxID=43928 RepID=A0A1M5PKL4_9EURY|nr:hypothetical protein [Halobaculum gomorrense]SHH02069.1 hypothetical protein SAMN05443636_1636 [Halobaculum gomorrense]
MPTPETETHLRGDVSIVSSQSVQTDSEDADGVRVHHAFSELVSQEFSPSVGHVTTILSGCVFAPSLFVFWFVNGVIDFSTALAIGAVSSAAGLQVRLLAYVLLIPVFLAARVVLHLLDPEDRRAVLSGSCPQSRYLSLDWVSVGILATGLPFALRDIGPWLGGNLVVVLGVFVLPRVAPERWVVPTKVAAFVVGPAVFLYAKYGAFLPIGPAPATVLGPVATLQLTPATVELLATSVNSLALGPVIVAGFAVLSNRVLTRPEIRSLPVVHHALPHRDPDSVVVVSAVFGTVFYLVFVFAMTGAIVGVPPSIG